MIESSRETPLVGEERSDFDEAYAFVTRQSLEWLKSALVRLGRWPASREPVGILTPEEAARRLANRKLAALALAKAITVVEDTEAKLYTVRTPDLATGVRVVHHVLTDPRLRKGIRDAYGKDLEA